MHGDYQGVTDHTVMFEAEDVTQSHRFIINQDMECDIPPNENIALNSGISDIFVNEPRATVTIDDSGESECSKFD